MNQSERTHPALDELENSRDKTPTQNTRTESELRALCCRLIEIQDNERRAIAQELHGEIAQYMAMLKLVLDKATRDPSSQKTISSLCEAQILVRDLMRRVVDLSLDLQPSMLDDLGLLPALLWYFEHYGKKTGVQVNFEHTELDRNFTQEINTAAYRIVQEALTNVARHARVNEVIVHIWANQGTLYIRIEDKGTGFNVSALAPSASAGLIGMRERALMLSGKLKIQSTPGTGTLITVEIPLASDKKDSDIKKRVTCVNFEKKF